MNEEGQLTVGEQQSPTGILSGNDEASYHLAHLVAQVRMQSRAVNLDQARAKLEAAVGPSERTVATVVLANKLNDIGDPRSAEELLRSCLYHQQSDEQLQSFVYTHLFSVLLFVGRTDEAENLLCDFEANPSIANSAVLIVQKAAINSRREQHVTAITLWRRAIDRAQAEGSVAVEMMARNGYAVDLLAMNALDEAEYQCRQVLLEYPWTGRLSGHAAHYLGLVLARKGAIAESLLRLDRPPGSEKYRRMGDCRIALSRAEALLSCRLLDEAEQAAAMAVALTDDPLDTDKRGDAYFLRARVAIAARQLAPALSDISAALEIFKAEGRPRSVERAEQLLRGLDPTRLADFRFDAIVSDAALIEALFLTINRARTPAETVPYLRVVAQAAAADNIRERVLGLSAAVQLKILTGDTDRANELIDELLDALNTLSRGMGSIEMLSNIFLDLSGLEFIAVTLGQHVDARLSFQVMDAAVARIHRTGEAKPRDTEFVAQLTSLREAYANRRFAGTIAAASNDTDAAASNHTDASVLPVAESTATANLEPEFVALERRIRFLSRQAEFTAIGHHGRWLDDPPPTSPTVSFLVASGEVWRLFTDGSTARMDCVGAQDDIEREFRRFRFIFDLAVNGFRPNLAVDAVRSAGLAPAGRLLGGLDIEGSDLNFRLYRCLTNVPWRLLSPDLLRRSWVNPGVPSISEPRLIPPLAKVAIVIGPDLGQPALDEAAAITAIYPSVTILSGSQATVQQTLRAFEDADLVHLVGHGMPHADDPLLARVRLHDGPLTAYDLDSIENPPAVVVLAACGLGSSGTRGRGAAYGLPGVLLRRGTLSVVGSPMVIDNALMSPIMANFHQALAGGATPVDALANLPDGEDKQALTAKSVISMQAGPLLPRIRA